MPLQQTWQTQLLLSYSCNDEQNSDQAGSLEFRLACHYELQSSYLRAQFWYHTSARKGHSQAQNNLAVIYALGRVEGPSSIDALDWFLDAAEQGDSLAQRNLKCLKMDGESFGKTRFVI